MTKGEFIIALGRRLGAARRNIERHVEALHGAGTVLPVAGSRRFPPDLPATEAVAILLGYLGSDRIEDAPGAARRLAALVDNDGHRLGDVMATILNGPPAHIGHLIVRPASASIVVDGRHMAFGAHGDGAANFVSGHALMAIAAEFQGASPDQADAMAALVALKL